jgi:hypothetical protein
VLQSTDQRALNLAYGDLVRKRVACHQVVGDTDEARKELRTLRNDLAARGANPPVLERIEAYATALGSPGRAGSNRRARTRSGGPGASSRKAKPASTRTAAARGAKKGARSSRRATRGRRKTR